MATARMLDQFRPRALQTGPSHPTASGMFVTGADETGQRPTRREKEHLSHFTYWNYVGIKRKLDMFCEPFPQMGIPVKGGKAARGKAQRYNLDQRSREWLMQSYGSRWIQSVNDDLDPLPDDHLLSYLLWHVNSEDCWQEFLYETGMMWELTGRFYWLVIPDQFGIPLELWVVPTYWVSPVYAKSGELLKWLVKPDTTTQAPFEFPADWILEGKYKSPKGKRDAWSSLHAGPKWVDSVEAIETSRHSTFKSGINPDVMLIFEAERYQNPQIEILNRIEEKFLNRIAGVDKSGRPLMVPPGVKAEKWSRTPKEMDYGTSSEQARDNNLALHGVSRTIAGFNDDVNRATFEGSLAWFCRFVMNPMFRLFAGILTEKLAPRFDDRILLWYPDCTPANSELELQQDKADFEMGALDPDEQRMKRGREPKGKPLYQTGWIASGRVPLDEELQPEPEPEPGSNEPGQEASDDEEEEKPDEDDE